MKNWLESKLQGIDFKVVLIFLFIAVSTGHVGRLFADREATGQWVLGYLLAIGVDGVLAVSLYEAVNANKSGHQRWALAGFVVTCFVSAGFNIYYYRLTYMTDHVLLSSLLGITAPLLAAFLAVLKSKGDVQRRGVQSELELARLRIEKDTEHAIAIDIEKERTKQERELTKRLKLEAETRAKLQQEEETAAQSVVKQREALANLGKSADILQTIREMPEITRTELGQRHDIGLRTVDYHTKKLMRAGAISRNGQGYQILWDERILEELP